MKKIALLICTIFFLLLFAVIYADSAALNKKNDLYNESLRIEKSISKYDLILNEMEGIRHKVKILERKKIDDKRIKEFLYKAKNYLKTADETRAKQSSLIIEYNHIVRLYNHLPSQKILFSNGLPKKLDGKTQRDRTPHC
jgi:hypothetical protein